MSRKPPTKAALERFQKLVPGFVEDVRPLLATGRANFKSLCFSQGLWQKLESGRYKHPHFLKTMLKGCEPWLCDALKLQDRVDYVFKNKTMSVAYSPKKNAVDLPENATGKPGIGTGCKGLPAPVREFVGRVAIIDRLTRFLFDDRHTVYYLYGPQGIGKSEIVKTFLTKLEKQRTLLIQFPDGAAYANRHTPGETRSPMARTATILLQHLQRYQPPGGYSQVIIDDMNRLLRGRRALLVVDNVNGLIEVEQLSGWMVKGVGKVILLGMERIPRRPDWIGEKVPPFDESELDEYLNSFYPNVAGEVKADHKLHGNRPKYVWQLACYHSDPIKDSYESSAEYFEACHSSPHENRHFAVLAEEDQNSLLALSVFNGHFQVEAAAMVLDLSHNNAQAKLNHLTSLSWLCRDETGHFFFHSVEHSQLTKLLKGRQRTDARLAHTRYLLNKLIGINELFLLGQSSQLRALQEFNTYRQDVFDNFDFLAHEGKTNAEAAAACRSLLWAAPNVLAVAFPYSRQKDWADRVEKVLGYQTDHRCAYHAKWFSNLYYYLSNEFERAASLAKECVGLARELGDDRLLMEALWNLGHAEMQTARLAEATPGVVAKSFLEAAELGQKIKDKPLTVCHLHFHTGWAHMYAQQYELAAHHLQRALELAIKTGDVYAQGRILISISRNLRKQGQVQAALTAGQEAHKFAQESTNNVLEALSHRNLSRIYEAMNEMRLAWESEKQWHSWKVKTGHPSLEETNERCRRFKKALESQNKLL